MATKEQEEIDLLFFIKKINQFFKRVARALFDALGFIRRNWIIILVLILAGVGYGYYVQSNTSPSQKAKVLLRINFDSVNYVYSLVENLNENIKDGTLVVEDKELNKVKALELKPIINFRNILEKYDENDRRLDILLRNIDYEFEDDDEFSQLPETFRSEYKYHFLNVVVSGNATEATLTALINFINSNEVLQEIKAVSVESIEDRIESNEETIAQINEVLEKYKVDDNRPGTSSTQLYVVDNFDIADIFESKMTLQKEMEGLRRDLVFSKDVVVNVNKPQLYRNLGITSNKMVFYPVLFLFVFFLLALLRTFYFSLKRIAEEE